MLRHHRSRFFLRLYALFLVAAAGLPERAAAVVDLATALQSQAHLASRVSSHVERRELGGGLAHYLFEVPVGTGEWDVIRLHRIVREHAPWFPARARQGVMLAHGDGWGFEATFLAAAEAPGVDPDRSIAAFLAGEGVDVWGLDFRWARVPAEVEDLGFMSAWGLDSSLEDLDAALATARAVRFVSGSGISRLHLLGFSRGGQIGWAQMGAETQRHPALAHVKTFIPVDNVFKTDSAAFRQAQCDSFDGIQAQLDAGEVVTDFRVVAQLGDLALDTPFDPSPFFPSLSNADLAEWIGASAGGGAVPAFHSVGGQIDPATFETELLYTQPELWFTFLSSISPYQPLRINLDGASIACEEVDVPYDDHLGEIRRPIFYIGATGAFGDLGVYAATLTDSADVQTLIVEEAVPATEDWGHNDLFLATDGEARVWLPVLDWIRDH